MVTDGIAQSIVEDMKNIISQEINYFDDAGILIASTDKSRVGDYHGGARRVIEMNEDIVVSHDGEYEGARKGINLPIYIGKKIVGVIGITGEEIEVEKYGKIIKKMTEILIKEAYIKEEEEREKGIESQIVEELLFRYYSDEDTLLNRVQILDIDKKLDRLVIVTRAKEISNNHVDLTMNEEIFEIIRGHIKYNPKNLIAKNGMNIIVIYELRDREDITFIIETIRKSISTKIKHAEVFFGIGNIYSDILSVKKSYEEAKHALDIGIALKKENIIKYDDLDIGILLNDISIKTVRKFIDKVFCKLSKKEVLEYEDIIDIYIKHNGSINRAANELFIHKNTLQYKLDKFYNITGYNPRDLNDICIIYLAFTLNRLEIRL